MVCTDIGIAPPLSRHILSTNEKPEILCFGSKKIPSSPSRLLGTKNLFFYYLFPKESIYSCRIFSYCCCSQFKTSLSLAPPLKRTPVCQSPVPAALARF